MMRRVGVRCLQRLQQQLQPPLAQNAPTAWQAPAHNPAALQLPCGAWRRLLSSTPDAGSSSTAGAGPSSAAAAAAAAASSAPRSMLDAAFAHPGAAGEALGSAAEARLQRLQAEAAAAALAQHSTQPSLVQRGISLIGDLLLLGGLAVAGAAGYMYARYDIAEIEKQVAETRARAAEAAEVLDVRAAAPATAAAAPGAVASSSQQSAVAAPPPEDALPLSERAWLLAAEQYLRFAKPLERKVREYTDPSCAALLPDMAPEHKGRIKTLVLDLEGVLVHKEWTRARGWLIHKRPGAEAFISQMGQYYEIVIYTDEQNVYTDPIINRLDVDRVIPYRLYRADTQYKDGKHVRDLSKLNRDLAHVLFVAADPEAYEFQPENTLKLKPWHGDPNDTTLLDLIPFLQMIATRGVRDVRDVVRSYDGEDDVAKAFKERLARLGQKQHVGSKGRAGALAVASAK